MMSLFPSFSSHQGWDSSVKCDKGSAHILQDAHPLWVFCPSSKSWCMTELTFPSASFWWWMGGCHSLQEGSAAEESPWSQRYRQFCYCKMVCLSEMSASQQDGICLPKYLVIHCSITLNIGLLPCLGHSSSRCFFMSPRICLKQRECSHCTVQFIFPKITVTINFPFSGRVHLLQAFCHAVTSVHYGLFAHCYIRSAWGTFSHPLGFPFAQRLREFAAMVSLNTYEHLFLLGLLQYHCYGSSCIL